MKLSKLIGALITLAAAATVTMPAKSQGAELQSGLYSARHSPRFYPSWDDTCATALEASDDGNEIILRDGLVHPDYRLNCFGNADPQIFKRQPGRSVYALDVNPLSIDMQFLEVLPGGRVNRYIMHGYPERKLINATFSYLGPVRTVIPTRFKGNGDSNDEYLKYESNCRIAEESLSAKVISACARFHSQAKCAQALSMTKTRGTNGKTSCVVTAEIDLNP